MGSWRDWAANVNARHANTLFCGIYGFEGNLYGSIGDQCLAGQPMEVHMLMNLPPDSATNDVCVNGIHYGGIKYMYSKSIEAKEGMPNCLHFFNRKAGPNEKLNDDDKYILCLLKCNTVGLVALSKGGSQNQGIVKAVCDVGEMLHALGC